MYFVLKISIFRKWHPSYIMFWLLWRPFGIKAHLVLALKLIILKEGLLIRFSFSISATVLEWTQKTPETNTSSHSRAKNRTGVSSSLKLKGFIFLSCWFENYRIDNDEWQATRRLQICRNQNESLCNKNTSVIAHFILSGIS